MATKAELTKKVDDLTAAATAARTTWKEAIPGPDDPKMTDDEQAEVDRLEEAYNTAKAARKAAEKELANWIEAQRVAEEAGTPVNAPVANELEDKLQAAWVSDCVRMGYNTSNPRPKDWNPFN